MNEMEKIMEEMAEYVCDNICRHRTDAGPDQDRMDDICAECEMGDHVCHVLNEYERVKGGRERTAPWSDRMMNRFMKVN